MGASSPKARRKRSRATSRFRPFTSERGMARNSARPVSSSKPILQVQELQVYYGESGAVLFDGRKSPAAEPHEIVRAGVGFVPQGRRLWPSLSVDETLRLSERAKGSWTVERVYSTFPRLAARRGK